MHIINSAGIVYHPFAERYIIKPQKNLYTPIGVMRYKVGFADLDDMHTLRCDDIPSLRLG